MRRALAILSLAAVLGGAAVSLRTARAQEPLDVDLARVCVGEAGWGVVDTGECAAIHAVIVSRAEARRSSFGATLHAYARNHFDASRSARPWIAGLNVRGTEPAHWPARLDWQRYAPRWQATIAHAGKVRRGEVALPCVGPVSHWGGSMDDARARRAGLVRVECAAGVRNHFWRLPRRVES